MNKILSFSNDLSSLNTGPLVSRGHDANGIIDRIVKLIKIVLDKSVAAIKSFAVLITRPSKTKPSRKIEKLTFKQKLAQAVKSTKNFARKNPKVVKAAATAVVLLSAAHAYSSYSQTSNPIITSPDPIITSPDKDLVNPDTSVVSSGTGSENWISSIIKIENLIGAFGIIGGGVLLFCCLSARNAKITDSDSKSIGSKSKGIINNTPYLDNTPYLEERGKFTRTPYKANSIEAIIIDFMTHFNKCPRVIRDDSTYVNLVDHISHIKTKEHNQDVLGAISLAYDMVRLKELDGMGVNNYLVDFFSVMDCADKYSKSQSQLLQSIGSKAASMINDLLKKEDLAYAILNDIKTRVNKDVTDYAKILEKETKFLLEKNQNDFTWLQHYFNNYKRERDLLLNEASLSKRYISLCKENQNIYQELIQEIETSIIELDAIVKKIDKVFDLALAATSPAPDATSPAPAATSPVAGSPRTTSEYNWTKPQQGATFAPPNKPSISISFPIDPSAGYPIDPPAGSSKATPRYNWTKPQQGATFTPPNKPSLSLSFSAASKIHVDSD